MFLVFGLGNPGRQYDGTRHNIGFEVIDLLAKRQGIKIKAMKFDAYGGEDFCLGDKLVLVKPTSYMNLSGTVVKKIARYYKLAQEEFLERLIVVYDDTDLPTGQIRIRQRGSAGGHNGMKNILYMLETEDFIRIRVGVGGKKEGWSQSGHVLGRFDKSEQDAAVAGIIAAADAIEDIMRHGVTATMNKQNQKDEKPKPPPKSYKNAQELLADVKSQRIDGKFAHKIEKMYDAKLDEFTKKLLSVLPRGCFFEDKDDGILSFLSRSRILSASVDVELDFVELGLIPLFDTGDNDFIAYDTKNGGWCMFSLASATKFDEAEKLEDLLG